MNFSIDQSIEILQRTPAVLRSMLAGLSDGWLQGNYGPDTFSPFDVVGHLITGEKTDWMVRARIILEQWLAEHIVTERDGAKRTS